MRDVTHVRYWAPEAYFRLQSTSGGFKMRHACARVTNTCKVSLPTVIPHVRCFGFRTGNAAPETFDSIDDILTTLISEADTPSLIP